MPAHLRINSHYFIQCTVYTVYCTDTLKHFYNISNKSVFDFVQSTTNNLGVEGVAYTPPRAAV
jgi:hypothetical protein